MTDQLSSVYAAFVESAQAYPDHPFLRLVEDTAARYGMTAQDVTYRQALAQINTLAANYHRLGVRPQTRVALGLDNRPEMFYHWLALNALGTSVVPLNPEWRAAELEYVLTHSEVERVVCLPDRVSLLAPVAGNLLQRPEVNSHDVFAQEAPGSVPEQSLSVGEEQTECALLYTSGTTGKPKGCVLSNEYFLVAGQWYRDLGGLCALQPGEDVLLTPLPMYHMNAMASSTMAMILIGGCIVPLDRFHPDTFWQSLAQSEATILHYLGVMPVILMGMPASDHDRSHQLRFGFGAGLSGDLHRQFETRFGFPLVEAWAMTETGCSVAIIANHEPRQIGTACFGRAPAHIDYRVVDDSGQAVVQGETGELLVRRAGEQPRYGFFSEYLKDPEATAQAWASGYFHTGDLVFQDADGAFHFVDRKKNIIRRSGENIAAVEVEEVLLEHDAVSAVGVAAVPDATRGDEVCACIVTSVSESSWPQVAEDIVSHCLARLAYYKAPGYVARVDELPLTATKKVQRGVLKSMAAELVSSGQCQDTRENKSHRSARGGSR